jgi:hypothetical protein
MKKPSVMDINKFPSPWVTNSVLDPLLITTYTEWGFQLDMTNTVKVAVTYGKKPPTWDTKISPWPPLSSEYQDYPINIKTDLNYEGIPDALIRLIYDAKLVTRPLNPKEKHDFFGAMVYYTIPEDNNIYDWFPPLVLPMKLPQHIPDCYIQVGRSEYDPIPDRDKPCFFHVFEDEYETVDTIKRNIQTSYYTNLNLVFNQVI